MKYEIVDDENPIIRQKAEKFDFDNPPIDPYELFEDMKQIMIDEGAVGLSGPQIGLPYQVFLLGNPWEPETIFSVFNPKIVDYIGEDVMGEEGCLTYPGLFIKIKRPFSIRARFSGHDGKVDTMQLDGYTARVFQHEYDHLHGITFVDRATKLQFRRAKEQKKKLDRKRKRNAK